MNNYTDVEFAGLDNIVDVSGSCFHYVKDLAKNQIWNRKTSILKHHVARFHVQLIVIAFITNFFHFFFKRIHLPRFTSEILTGILLGEGFFEKEFRNASRLLFPPTPDILMSSLAKLGFMLFAFAAGVRMDPSLVSRSGRKPWILGLSMLFISNVLHVVTPYCPAIDSNDSKTIQMDKTRLNFSHYVTVIHSQFVGVSNILMQLKLTNSRLGHLALAATMISHLFRFGFIVVFGYLGTLLHISLRVTLHEIFLSTIFILVIFYPLRYLLLWFIKNTSEDKPIKEIYTTLAVALVLTSAAMGQSLGLMYSYIPLILGLLVPAGSRLATNILQKIETMVHGLLMPLLATFCAMKFDLRLFIERFPDGDYMFILTLSGYMVKLIATYIAAISCKLSFKDAAAFTLIVNTKGVLDVGDIMSFSSLQGESASEVFLVFLLATMTTPLVKILYDPTKQYIGYKKKSVEQTPDDTMLQIVVCGYKQEDAIAAVKLLEFSNLNKQNPITVFGLCLEELVGSDTPVWIDHQLGQKANTNRRSQSHLLIDVFKNFKSQHKKQIQLHLFTAISPIKQMHEDVCRLSFERAASLVIVPFHKKWNNRGKLVSTNKDIRALNINVLERAPCSVGILIDRGLNATFSKSRMYRVCVVFIGGPDDREALAYALRMTGSDRVQLIIMHFTVPKDLRRNSWEAILDNEALKGLKGTMIKNHMDIEYTEEIVKDGSITESILSQKKDQFDLFIVGRNHDSNPQAVYGLSDWMELAELGPLGDVLASTEFSSSASILVIRQQIMKASHSSTLN